MNLKFEIWLHNHLGEVPIELLSHDRRTADPDLLEIRCGLEFLSKEGSIPSVMGLVAETGNELEVI